MFEDGIPLAYVITMCIVQLMMVTALLRSSATGWRRQFGEVDEQLRILRRRIGSCEDDASRARYKVVELGHGLGALKRTIDEAIAEENAETHAAPVKAVAPVDSRKRRAAEAASARRAATGLPLPFMMPPPFDESGLDPDEDEQIRHIFGDIRRRRWVDSCAVC